MSRDYVIRWVQFVGTDSAISTPLHARPKKWDAVGVYERVTGFLGGETFKWIKDFPTFEDAYAFEQNLRSEDESVRRREPRPEAGRDL